MGRVVVRALGVLAALVVVPVAVNVGTGGTLPEWLAPFAGWLWPAAGAALLLVLGTEIREAVRRPSPISPRRPDPRNAELALAQVIRFVEQQRRTSLGWVGLTLAERPEAVRRPAHLVRRIGGQEHRLADRAAIQDVFRELTGSMLLLGAPGAGKTTQLLDLAEALAAAARPSRTPSIPVLVDLADWSRSRRRRLPWSGRDAGPRDFEAWFFGVLDDRYGIPEAVGRSWFEQNRITLLFDGLDEVRESLRTRCVEEINRLVADRPVAVAVSSREAEYAALAPALRLQGAVVIQPLTRGDAAAWLAEVGVATPDDDDLWELLTTPLMLTVLALAQAGGRWRDLPESADAAEQRRLVFDAFVVEMLARARGVRDLGEPEPVLRRLQVLAAVSRTLDLGVRVSRPDGTTLRHGLGDHPVASVIAFRLYPILAGVAALLTAAEMGYRFSAAAGVTVAVVIGVAAVGLVGVTVVMDDRVPGRAVLVGYAAGAAACVGAMSLGLHQLAMVAAGLPPVLLAGSAFVIGAVLVAMFFIARDVPGDSVDRFFGLLGVAVGLLLPAVILWVGVDEPVLDGWAVGATFVIAWSVSAGLLNDSFLAEVLRRMRELAAERAARVLGRVIVAAATLVAIPVVLSSNWTTPFLQPIIGWVSGVASMLLVGVAAAAVTAPVVARVAFRAAGEPLPWGKGFLRLAAERGLLVPPIDGPYRFAHLLIRDHLADCDPAELAPQVVSRRAELLG